MNDSILQEQDFNEIHLSYHGEDNSKIYIEAALRYCDNDVCFFGFPLPLKYVRPKKKSDIFVTASTQNGLYRTKVKFIDATMSFNEILCQVSLPKTWVVTQRRNGSRKEIHLPLKLNFNDKFEIETCSTDLSVGGVSFTVKKPIPEEYQNTVFTMTLQLEKSKYINFDTTELTFPARILRYTYNDNDEIKYACCFVNITKPMKENLKTYIMFYE